jgi:diacylglycerol kinase family enzyme
MVWSEWLSVLALLVAVAALVMSFVAVSATRVRRPLPLLRAAAARPAVTALPAPDHPPTEPAPRTGGTQVAFVCNPTKPGAVELRDAAIRACATRYLPEPLWFETTADDPGVGQARAAVERGAQTVVAVGGDGTVRAVAEALAGSDVAMGLVPLGTGNLLARNLDLPLTDTEELLRIALTGPERVIDVGWLRVERYEETMSDDIAEAADDVPGASGGRVASAPGAGHEPPRDHIFLVIAGVGFDAAVMGEADEQLKARMGWLAYPVTGFRHLLDAQRIRLRISVDGGPTQSLRLRSLLIGNCGRLPGGITLLPYAELDDGILDLGAVDTRGGLAGWTQLFGEVALQGVGLQNELPGKIGKIEHLRARSLSVVADRAEPIQVDGDNIGSAQQLSARVDPGALRVRTAAAAA